MAGTNPAMVVKIAADISAMRAALKEGTSVITTTTAAMQKLATSFSGDKLVQHAHNVTAAINQVGVATLTAAEAARNLSVLERAMAKLALTGKPIPADMRATAAALSEVAKTTSVADKATGLFTGTFARLTAAFSAAHLITRAVSTLVSWTSESIRAAGSIVDLANKTGLTTETIQRMSFVAKQTSTDIDSFTRAAFKLGVQLSGDSKSVVAAVHALGLSYETLKAQSPDKQFELVTKALEGMIDPQERNRLGVLLFGKTFQDIASAVSEGYSKMALDATVSSDTQIRALDAAGDAFDRFIEKSKKTVTSFIGNVVLYNQGLASAIKAVWAGAWQGQDIELKVVKATQAFTAETSKATDTVNKATIAHQTLLISVDRSNAALYIYGHMTLPLVISGYESWIQRGIEANGTLRAGIPMWYGTAAATKAVGAELDTATFNLNAWILSLKQLPPEMDKVAEVVKDTEQNTAAAAAAWVQWGIQVVYALDRATQSASKAKNALSGALTGAQVGSQFGWWGAAIGGIAGALVGLFRDTKNNVAQMREDFIRSAGGLDVLEEKAFLAGVSLDRLFASNRVTNFEGELKRVVMQIEAWEKRVAGLNQAAGGLGSMTSGFAAPFEAALTKLDELKKSLTGLTGKELFAARVAIKQLEKDLVLMAAKGQQQFTNLGTYALATFAGMLKQTGSLSQAFDAVGPSLDALIKLQGSLGFTSSATVQELLNIRKVVTANQAVMQSVDGLNQVMAGLTAAGQINQALFTAFSQDATVLFAKLQAGGATGSQALALMQPTLQQLWQLQQTFGFAVDAGTQALIDQAVAQGIVGAKHKSVSDKMLEALLGIQGAVEALALVLTQGVGGALGDLGTRTRTNAGEWRTWGDHVVAEAIRAKRALDSVHPPSTSVPGPAGGGGVPSSATSTQTTSGRGGSSSTSSTSSTTVHVHVSGPQSTAQSQETGHIVANELIKLLETNQGGARTKTRKALRVG